MTQSNPTERRRYRPPAGYVGMDEAMRITGLTRLTVSKHAREGNIHGAIKPTKAWFFTVAGLNRFNGVEEGAA